MNRLDTAKRDAQASADRDGQPRSVLNLNRVGSPLYVIRDQPTEEAARRNGEGWLVWTALPREAVA